MTAIAVQTQLTPEEYLDWERKAPFKNEYLSGQILAMSGASRAHNLITGNILTDLNNQLVERECVTFISKMRVKARPITSYFYPDVTVVCDEPRFEDDVFDTLLNPTVVVEVLSRSTATYDKGEKFEAYKQIMSLQEYILVSQDRLNVERHFRLGTQWKAIEFQALADVLPLDSIRCELPLEHIYRRVKFTDTP
ncbi:Uma2 family endonuclease [Candidatus Poribacteria bacterium]|nr:Uma2 family endonuclease [Candidatus Poribacteria bacterium]MYA98141.1 Uma2 family endonuclease [Candidatus Poribacteria bacterium]